MKSVYSAVRSGDLNRAVCASFLKIKFYMFKNTTAAIYCSVCSSLLNCIILLASPNIPVLPQQNYVCSLCTSKKFHLPYL